MRNVIGNIGGMEIPKGAVEGGKQSVYLREVF